jgi:hypothetical protein
MASQTTAYTRFCVTSHGSIGLVPDRTEVGDVVASFDGSANQFVLRVPGRKRGKKTMTLKATDLLGAAICVV